MKLNEIRDNDGSVRNRKRVGRGIGSGMGKTSTRGHKGQKSRSGGSIRPGFEGGQMPLYRRLPKRGFKNPFRLEFTEVNLGRLQLAIDNGKLDPSAQITEESMREAGLFQRRRDGVRLLANGELKVALNMAVTGASRPAIAAVEKAGGTVSVIAKKAVPVSKKAKAAGKKAAPVPPSSSAGSEADGSATAADGDQA
jgi:large subunit ribosomal protein L15